MKRIKKSECVEEVVSEILSGNLVCFPTDTLYGILGSALRKDAVEKAYRIKGRDREKPLIVLFDSIKKALDLGVKVPENLSKIYPAPVTFVLPLEPESPFRQIFQRDNLAIRIPDDETLRKIISLSHPVFAPSANPQGKSPAENCRECYAYFDGEITLCVEGKPGNKPSTIVSLTGEGPKLLREGAVPFEKILEVMSWKG
ncbi:MAG: L-threonylcarbamoyladenylate synthase [Desulfurobacteriaceae bacterium]